MSNWRETHPPAEATTLAWLCGCTVDDVLRGARVVGVRLSPLRLCSGRDLRRLAYHLGTILDARPRGRYDLARHAGIVKVLLPSEDSPTGQFVDLLGVRSLTLPAGEGRPAREGYELLLCDGTWWWGPDLEAAYAAEHPRWRYATHHVRAGSVHGEEAGG